MRPRAEKLWKFLSEYHAASGKKSWYGTYAQLARETGMNKKEVTGAVADLVREQLINKINHGRAGIELNLQPAGAQAGQYKINNCGWCGAKVAHPDFSYCTNCGKPLVP